MPFDMLVSCRFLITNKRMKCGTVAPRCPFACCSGANDCSLGLGCLQLSGDRQMCFCALLCLSLRCSISIPRVLFDRLERLEMQKTFRVDDYRERSHWSWLWRASASCWVLTGAFSAGHCAAKQQFQFFKFFWRRSSCCSANTVAMWIHKSDTNFKTVCEEQNDNKNSV